MELARFLDNNHYEVIQGSINKYITSISYNSNTVTKGGAFVAIKGFSDDGHNYIYNAIKNGATVIFIQNPLSDSYRSEERRVGKEWRWRRWRWEKMKTRHESWSVE